MPHGHDLGARAREEQLVGRPHVDRRHGALVAGDPELAEQLLARARA